MWVQLDFSFPAKMMICFHKDSLLLEGFAISRVHLTIEVCLMCSIETLDVEKPSEELYGVDLIATIVVLSVLR